MLNRQFGFLIVKYSFLFSIVILRFGISEFAQAQSPESSTTASDILLKKNNDLEKLYLTHSIFSAGIVLSLSEFDNPETFNHQFYAYRNYLLSFLNEWFFLIQNSHFKTTRKLFAFIQNRKGFLGKHFSVWEKIFNPRENFLGYNRGLLLQHLLDLEENSSSSSEMVAHWLNEVSAISVAHDGDLIFAFFVANVFRESNDKSVKEAALNIFKASENRKYTTAISFGFSFLAGMALVKGAGSLQWMARGLQFSKRAIDSNLSRTLLKASQHTRVKVSHMLAQLQPVHYGFIGSATFHGAMFELTRNLNLFPKREATTPNLESETASAAIPISVSIALLQVQVDQVYPQVHNVGQDFKAQFVVRSKADLISDLEYAIRNASDSVNYGELFLQAEKQLQVDQFPIEDTLAFDYIKKQLRQYEYQISDLLKSGPLTRTLEGETLDTARRILLGNHFQSYKRDYPNLTAPLLGWGGNCVSQTELLIGQLMPYEKQLPKGQKFGVVLFSDHIEAVIYEPSIDKPKTITFLVNGRKVNSTHGKLLEPKVLLQTLLSNFIAFPKKSGSWTQSSSSQNFTSPNSGLLNFSLKKRDRGALEGIKKVVENLNLLSNSDKQLSPLSKNPPPESAIIIISNITETSSSNEGGLPLLEIQKNKVRLKNPNPLILVRVVPRSHHLPFQVISMHCSFCSEKTASDPLCHEVSEDRAVMIIQISDPELILPISNAAHVFSKDQTALLNLIGKAFERENRRYILLEDFQRHYQRPSENLEVLKNLKSIDLDGYFRLAAWKSYFENRFPLEFFRSHIKNWENLKTGFSWLQPVDFRQSNDEKILEAIAQNPEKMIQVLDAVEPAVKYNFFARWFSNSYAPISSEGTGLNGSMVLKSQKANEAIIKYLQSLSSESVQIRASQYPYRSIELPRASNCGGFFICVGPSDAQNSQTNVKEEKYGNEKNSISLQANTLYFFAYAFLEGIHLWNDHLVDGFLNELRQPSFKDDLDETAKRYLTLMALQKTELRRLNPQRLMKLEQILQ